MKTIKQFPRRTETFEDIGIVMPDGVRLSARIWMPKDAAKKPVPAILEHLPYRKSDGTRERDSWTHPYLAGHGYACIRVDMRGNGDSEGIMEDEYTAQELQDACDVIAWAAAQPWCNGKVGMMGISWGGFNALQVAALRPPALKAIITLCSTDDRYADDIHYKGGLLLHENLGWGATMLSFSSRPPDPALVGKKWRKMWKARLEANPLLQARWMRHPARDAYWKHGSVCENYAAIEAKVLAIGGWGDAYKNSVSRIVTNVGGAKGIIGPWIHKYPHFALPNPMGFLQEALRWWDRWLTDIDTGVENDPAMRIFVQESERPKPWYDKRRGNWIAEKKWPSANIKPKRLALKGDRTLGTGAAKPFALDVKSPADTGLQGGEYCAIYWGPELPDDQRRDDALSLTFDAPALDAPLDIVGAPVIRLRLKSDKPVAQLAVRLNDVYPDGASTRITWGVLNLCHRNGHEAPEKIQPGEWFEVEFQLDDIAWRVPVGNRLRVSISPAYWPMVWPSPDLAMLTIGSGEIALPVRKTATADEWVFAPPEGARNWNASVERPKANKRIIEQDVKSGMVSVLIEDDMGRFHDRDTGLIADSNVRERWQVHPDDPLCAKAEIRWEQINEREGWRTRTVAATAMWSDAEKFTVVARVEAFEGERKIFTRDWREEIPRGCL